LLSNEIPINGLGENKLEVGIGFRFSRFRVCQALSVHIFESGHQLETQEMAETKSNLVLPMRIYKLLFHLHFGAMTQHSVNHGFAYTPVCQWTLVFSSSPDFSPISGAVPKEGKGAKKNGERQPESCKLSVLFVLER
jgi:hypothetical protein